MTRTPGMVRSRLAKLLQNSFPETPLGVKLTWSADWLYPATGSYRTNVALDCARWEGFARHYRDDGSFYTAWSVYAYSTMSELIKYKKLGISNNGEIFGVKE